MKQQKKDKPRLQVIKDTKIIWKWKKKEKRDLAVSHPKTDPDVLFLKAVSQHKIEDVKEFLKLKWQKKVMEVRENWWFFLLEKPKTFNSVKELNELFNSYLASCQKQIFLIDTIPVETFDRKLDKKELNNQKVILKWVNIDKSIDTKWIWTITPTKIWRCMFIWIHPDTRWEYGKKAEYSETVALINVYLEGVLENGAIAGTINSQIVQFLLNVNYWKVPKYDLPGDNDNNDLTKEELIKKLQTIRQRKSQIMSKKQKNQ